MILFFNNYVWLVVRDLANVWALKCCTIGWGDKAYRVADNGLHLGDMVGGKGFVSRLEIEDLSMTASPGAAASEYLAALEPTKENNLLGRGNVEHFAVHLLRVENEGLVNSCGDWVIGLDGPALSFRAYFRSKLQPSLLFSFIKV